MAMGMDTDTVMAMVTDTDIDTTAIMKMIPEKEPTA
jgi:hypothetical protein